MIILTQGIPGSGKTTWAKRWVQEDPTNRIRVSRDDIRRMLNADTRMESYKSREEIVSNVEESCVVLSIENGYSVVIDATHLKLKYINRWKNIADIYGVPILVKPFFVSLDEAKARNNKRSGFDKVPAEVVDKMYKQFTNIYGEVL